MSNYTLHIDGEEWTVGSSQAEYDAIHAVAGVLLAGAEEIKIVHREYPGFLHSDEDIEMRIDELQSMLDEDGGDR
jgi:hypothetical protein